MEQAVYILVQVTEANLDALENSFCDAGMNIALRYRATYLEAFLVPNTTGVAKTRIQKVAAIMVIFIAASQKNKERVRDMANQVVDPGLRDAIIAI